MITLAFIAASVAAVAVLVAWLWTRPDIRARLLGLANRLRPSAAQLKQGRAWLAPALALSAMVVLFAGWPPAALLVGTTSALAWLWDRAERRADAEQATARRRKDAQDKAEQARDSTLDAIAKLVTALESDTDYDVEAALDAAKWVLDGGDYTGRLRATQNAHEAAETELRDLRDRLTERGLLAEGVDAHAARIIAILADTANKVEPVGRLDAIRARVNGSTS